MQPRLITHSSARLLPISGKKTLSGLETCTDSECTLTRVAQVSTRVFGGQTMVERLRRVLVRSPDPDALTRWTEYGWRAPPDPARLLAEHEWFCNALTEFGAEVVVGRTSVEGDPDAIYAHDTSLICDDGAVVLRPGKDLRRGEVAAAAADLGAAGVPIIATLDDPACAEGGDIVWLREATLLVGWRHPTNGAGDAGPRD